MAKKRADSNAILPPDLARKISPWMVNSAEMTGVVGKSVLIGIVAFLLYGPVGTGKSDHNGFAYLLGPWIFPTLIALLWSRLLSWKRFRVYRGTPFAGHSYVDTGDDPAVMRLATLFNSNEARRHLWRETLKVSVILFAILGAATIVFRDSLNWTLPSPGNQFLATRMVGAPGSWFWLTLIGCPIFTFLLLTSDYQRWCLITWAKRESAHQVELHR
jgi:hypothetical protein